MFSLGKKKKSKDKDMKSDQAASVNASVNKQELMDQAEVKEKELAAAKGAARVDILNELGALYFQADELDKAITYYEESLESNKQMGKAYTDLMSLYNKKRQKAAEMKDDEQIKYYMDKVQGMMQMSKDMIRGRV